MKFGQTKIDGGLFKCARDKFLAHALNTVDEIRQHILKQCKGELDTITSIDTNQWIIANRVTRAVIDELMASGQITKSKRGEYITQ